MDKITLFVSSKDSIDRQCELLRAALHQHLEEKPGMFQIEAWQPTPRRTPEQNKMLHARFRDWAEQLNAAGLDMRAVMKPEAEIPWTEHSVKENLFKPLMKAMHGHTRTRELKKLEVSEVAETLIEHIASKFGVVLRMD